MPVHTEFIRDFLEKWETRQTRAYIPCRKRNFTGRNHINDCGEVIASSGVTVGTGLDLGQQQESDLRRMGIGEALIGLLSPYLGKCREEAVAALAARPLELSEGQADEIDEAVHTDYIRRAAILYDKSTVKSGLKFADVPPQAQAVVVSLFYQLGSPYGNPGYPNTWLFLCAGSWSAAARELQTRFTRYVNRRADEGRLLREIS